jgi:NAD(P)-dependent dehydrogenase (short-subunit alcohol dehydrogenase family)
MSEHADKKTTVITGATSGIGRSLVWKLDAAAHHLVLIGRSQEKLTELAGQLRATTTILAADLFNVEEIAALDSQMPARIDGFVHAAGVESVEPIKLVNYQKFDRIMRLHVYAFVELLKIIERNKKRTDEYQTSVVTVSSVASDGGGVGQTMYAASKAALEAAVRVLTKELATKRIRINAVKPGIVDTQMTRRWMRKIGVTDIADVHAMQVNGIAQPGEIADLIAFLLSDQARHIAGTQIEIDGGGSSGRIF